MTAAELKASILDLAVRGQLVPQDPKDKPADKPSDIDDPPYELPLNWVWKKIPQVAWFQEGPGIGKKDFRDKGVPLIRIARMQGSVVSLAGCNFLDPKIVNEREIQILDKQSFKSGEEKADVLVQRLVEKLGEQTLRAVVTGYSKEGRRETMKIVHDKKPERDYFSDPNLSVLFERHVNTIANWRKGRVKPPEGFSEAFEKKDYKAMCACAEKYKASRECADAMNTKGVEHGISEEQMHRLRLK